MKYRIDYRNGQRSKVVADRKSLLIYLSEHDKSEIEDIRKLYKSGVSDSVLEKYQNILSA